MWRALFWLLQTEMLGCWVFSCGKLLESARNCSARSFAAMSVGKRDLIAVLVFDTHESETERASWWRYAARLVPDLREICGDVKKPQAPPDIAALPWFRVHFCDRKIAKSWKDCIVRYKQPDVNLTDRPLPKTSYLTLAEFPLSMRRVSSLAVCSC